MKKLFEFFSRKKRRIEQLEKQVRDLKWKIDRLRLETNNFPSFAITAIPNSQLDKIMEVRDIGTMRHLINEYIKFIEQHDLAVHFAFMPKKFFLRFISFMGEDIKDEKFLWGIEIVPIEGLNTTIFISNLELSDEYITLNMKDKNDR